VFTVPTDKCIGMLEGLMQVNKEVDSTRAEQLQRLHNAALIIPSKEIRDYITDVVEQEMTDSYASNSEIDSLQLPSGPLGAKNHDLRSDTSLL